MLFSSYVFILLFLPVTLAGFALLSSAGRAVSLLWLLCASVVFYGFWNPLHVPLIAASITVNYLIGRAIQSGASLGWRRLAFATGIAGNLGLIGYYKYAGFFAGLFSGLSGQPLTIDKLILPLGISFFTFQQIAYLIDAWRGEARVYSPLEYAFVVLFFPHLIAGPIVRHSDLIDNLRRQEQLRLRSKDLSVGLVIFVMGLLKKILIADSIQHFVATLFGTVAGGYEVAPMHAWVGVLAYTLQLYFDFSGYSDMAIGLGRMFSVPFPFNFNSPYKATSIIDFWRRWHITLSMFLRDYLYIPLGGSRCGPVRRYANLLMTMTLGGLWHGAGWTFILWGVWHGLLLCANHGWIALRKRMGWEPSQGFLARSTAWALTFLAVIAGWVLFRAESLESAISILKSLAGLTFGGVEPYRKVYGSLVGLIALVAVTVLLPNTQQLLARYEPALDWAREQARLPALPRWIEWYTWKPTALRGAMLAVGFVGAIAMLTRVKEFLYFQF